MKLLNCFSWRSKFYCCFVPVVYYHQKWVAGNLKVKFCMKISWCQFCNVHGMSQINISKEKHQKSILMKWYVHIISSANIITKLYKYFVTVILIFIHTCNHNSMLADLTFSLPPTSLHGLGLKSQSYTVVRPQSLVCIALWPCFHGYHRDPECQSLGFWGDPTPGSDPH